MKKTESELLNLLSGILETCKTIKVEVESYLKESLQRPPIDGALLRILWCSCKANEMISPQESPGEIHGLPREICGLDTTPGLTIRHADRPSGWDFTPWLREKLGKMQKSAMLLTEGWLRDLKDVKVHPDAEITAEEFVRHGVLTNYHEVNRLAKTVFEELCNENIQIIEHD